MKKLFLALTLATGLSTSVNTSAEPVTLTAVAVGAAVTAIIANSDSILNNINPQTGTISDTETMWCIANEWKTRDQIVKQRGIPDDRRFSRKTQVFGFFQGATWYCYAKV
jgi:hypothetical protein